MALSALPFWRSPEPRRAESQREERQRQPATRRTSAMRRVVSWAGSARRLGCGRRCKPMRRDGHWMVADATPAIRREISSNRANAPREKCARGSELRGPRDCSHAPLPAICADSARCFHRGCAARRVHRRAGGAAIHRCQRRLRSSRRAAHCALSLRFVPHDSGRAECQRRFWSTADTDCEPSLRWRDVPQRAGYARPLDCIAAVDEA